MTHPLLLTRRNIQLKTIAVSLIAAAVFVCIGSTARLPDDLSHRKDRVSKLSASASFQWQVRESDGQLVTSSSDFHSTDAEALRAGNAAVRAIRKRGG